MVALEKLQCVPVHFTVSTVIFATTPYNVLEHTVIFLMLPWIIQISPWIIQMPIFECIKLNFIPKVQTYLSIIDHAKNVFTYSFSEYT